MKGSTTMSENEIREEGALGVFRRNPYYRKLYDDAPDGAKSYYRGCFVGSLEALGDQYKGMSGEERFHAILLSLTDEDWAVIIWSSGAYNSSFSSGISTKTL